MRVASLNDIHGNLPALEAVLVDVEREGVDAIVIGGDVAVGPYPRETLERLQGVGDGVLFLRGNADREAVTESAHAAVAWTSERLTDSQRALLAGLPTTISLEVDGLGPVLFCHGSPRSDEEILTKVSPDERLRAALAGVEERVVVCGHTHHQFDRVVDGWRLVNAGSVGMPYEGRPGAYWTLFGPDVEPRRTEYDVEAAARGIEALGYPDDLAELLRKPPPADEVAEYFESLAPRFDPAP
ncbi:MAG TPA: metallophosphoesterase family protein [Gaiellaceae bacterium]|jgi:putative phosphoesterase